MAVVTWVQALKQSRDTETVLHVTVKMAVVAIVLHSGRKRDLIPLFNFLGFNMNNDNFVSLPFFPQSVNIWQTPELFKSAFTGHGKQ